jgi:hypothetical protein
MPKGYGSRCPATLVRPLTTRYRFQSEKTRGKYAPAEIQFYLSFVSGLESIELELDRHEPA